jgi:hypothetical protein
MSRLSKAEEILIGAARAGARLRKLAAIYAEIRYCTAPPNPDDGPDPHLGDGVRVPGDGGLRGPADLVQGGRIYLAPWDSGHSGKVGPPCEMWFVSPDYGASSFPIAGRWKMRDNSLSSVGSVEGQLWGINEKCLSPAGIRTGGGLRDPGGCHTG